MKTFDTIAVIVAAGSGRRFGASMPKQFCDLGGRPLLMTTIEAFSALIPLENLRLVLSSDMIDLWNGLCGKHGFTSPKIVIGGETRHQSVKNAIDSLEGQNPDTTVLIHDGARPFPSLRLIEAAAEIPEGITANIPAVKVTDSLRELSDATNDTESSAVGSRCVDRARFVAVQTPQSARLSDLRAAYAIPSTPEMTDDASVLEAAGFTAIRLIEGDSFNMKVTNPIDLAIATAIMQSLNS